MFNFEKLTGKVFCGVISSSILASYVSVSGYDDLLDNYENSKSDMYFDEESAYSSQQNDSDMHLDESYDHYPQQNGKNSNFLPYLGMLAMLLFIYIYKRDAINSKIIKIFSRCAGLLNKKKDYGNFIALIKKICLCRKYYYENENNFLLNGTNKEVPTTTVFDALFSVQKNSPGLFTIELHDCLGFGEDAFLTFNVSDCCIKISHRIGENHVEHDLTNQEYEKISSLLSTFNGSMPNLWNYVYQGKNKYFDALHSRIKNNGPNQIDYKRNGIEKEVVDDDLGEEYLYDLLDNVIEVYDAFERENSYFRIEDGNNVKTVKKSHIFQHFFAIMKMGYSNGGLAPVLILKGKCLGLVNDKTLLLKDGKLSSPYDEIPLTLEEYMKIKKKILDFRNDLDGEINKILQYEKDKKVNNNPERDQLEKVDSNYNDAEVNRIHHEIKNRKFSFVPVVMNMIDMNSINYNNFSGMNMPYNNSNNNMNNINMNNNVINNNYGMNNFNNSNNFH